MIIFKTTFTAVSFCFIYNNIKIYICIIIFEIFNIMRISFMISWICMFYATIFVINIIFML